MLMLGLLLLLLGCILYARSRQIATSHVWNPVDVPIRFDRENAVSAIFTADMQGTYYVQIEIERNLPFNQLNYILGVLQEGKRDTKNVPTIAWSVRSNGKEVPFGGYSGTYWSDNVGWTIGDFEAFPGQAFLVEVRTTAVPALQILNPHLKVEVASPEFKSFVVKSALTYNAAMLVFLVGLMVTIIGACKN